MTPDDSSSGGGRGADMGAQRATSPGSPMSFDEVVTTTRAVRKRLDLERPVAVEVVLECLDLAVHAPTGGNAQDWHFVVVTDPEQRQALADCYRNGAQQALAAGRQHPAEGQRRVYDSAWHLMEHFASVPVHVVACKHGRPPSDPAAAAGYYGSIFPAIWSLMLALRSRGLGSTLTTAHLRDERAAAETLGIPYDDVAQVALLPVAYTVGQRFSPALRRPAAEVTSLNQWGSRCDT